jgi:hypothetical protein
VAEAVGDLAALVGNFAETLQVVWQLQEGCRQECYGTSQSQSVTQGQDTTQVSMAASGVEPPVPAVPQVQIGVLPAWLIALATNVGATIQTIVQVQEATCERNCTGDAQVQVADQVAAVVQVAVAIAGRPPVDGPPVAPTSGDEPVDVLPPVAQPAPEQLVGSDQPPAQTGAPDEATPTAHGPSGRQPAWRPAHTGERSPQAAAPGRSRPALPPRQTVRAPAGDRASAHAEDESQRLGGLLGVVARASDSAQVPSVAQSLTTTDGLAHRVIAIVLTATLVVGFLVVLAAREWNRSVFPNK